MRENLGNIFEIAEVCIDYYEVKDNIIIVHYSDNSIETMPYTKEKERILLIEILNAAKRMINRFEDFDFKEERYALQKDFNPNYIALNIRIGMLSIFSLGMARKRITFLKNIKKQFEEDTRIALEELNQVEYTLKVDKFYINNMDLLENEKLKIIRDDKSVSNVKININTVSHVPYKLLEKIVAMQKTKKRNEIQNR